MKGKRKKRNKIIVFVLVIIFAMVLFAAVVGIYAYANIDFRGDEVLFLASKKKGMTTLYYDASGYYGENLKNYVPIKFAEISNSHKCEWVEYDNISQYLKDGFVAMEDRSFFTHQGINFKRTFGAMINYLFRGNSDFGGSTITQQVVKNISGDSKKSIKRKFDELIRASHIEEKYNKKEIFEVYLNVIPMGENMFGVGIASQKYFNKMPSDLTVAEAATLVGITNAPTRYNPRTSAKECIQKRNKVLYAMFEMGFINEDEYILARNSPLGVSSCKETDNEVHSWFVETVCDEICIDLMEKYGYSESAARMMILNGGLKVYTTLDPKIQAVMEEYFENTDNFSNDILKGLEYSMVITDSKSASLRGIIGSVGKKEGNRLINHATENKIPGSVLKPLALYAPLVESKKITWATVFDDVPVEFKNNNGEYLEYPRNSPAVYDGLTPISDALAYSKNTIAVRLFNIIGAKSIYKNLKNNYDFDSIIEKEQTSDGRIISDLSVSPLALGQLTYGIDLRKLTESYTVFSNEGELSKGKSYVLLLDENDGELIKKEHVSRDIITKESARLMTQMLMRVVDIGTASRITLKNIIDVAGKTGTSGGSKDKLFIGFTPQYVGGVWCGYGDYSAAVPSSAKNHLDVWDEIMNMIYKDVDVEGEEHFSTRGLEYKPYCRDSGKLYSTVCMKDIRGNRLEYGYFIADTVPRQICDRHILCEYDIISEGISVGNCPKENIVEIALLDIPERKFPKQVYVTDAEYVYREMPDYNNLCYLSDQPYFIYNIPEGEFVGISKGKKQFNSSCCIHKH